MKILVAEDSATVRRLVCPRLVADGYDSFRRALYVDSVFRPGRLPAGARARRARRLEGGGCAYEQALRTLDPEDPASPSAGGGGAGPRMRRGPRRRAVMGALSAGRSR